MKSIRIVVIIISISILLGILPYISPAKGTTTTLTKSTIADKDSYVSSGYPTTNYGGKDWFITGYYITDFCEAYFHFSFDDKPDNWKKAEISLDFYSISETFEISVVLITENWDELSITWMNKPKHAEIIQNITVAEEKIYKIDISDYIEGRSDISICINASNVFQTGHIQGSSREGYFSDEDAPQLIWTYESESNDKTETSELPEIPFGNFYLLTLILGIVLVIIKLKYQDNSKNL
ncbi:MAG: DUF7594 domain-containing protein [Promethearchaeia archaeon]